MIKREFPELSTKQQKAPPLTGLMSSLRGPSKTAILMAGECKLLRRFMYKNKNQFKGCGWWRKVVELDKVMSRTLAETQAWLSLFMGKESEKPKVVADTLGHGLKTLPRSILIVQKAIQTTLKTASILTQLVKTNAFLGFALVLLGVTSRLHNLLQELSFSLCRVPMAFITMMEANSSYFPPVSKVLSSIPKKMMTEEFKIPEYIINLAKKPRVETLVEAEEIWDEMDIDEPTEDFGMTIPIKSASVPIPSKTITTTLSSTITKPIKDSLENAPTTATKSFTIIEKNKTSRDATKETKKAKTGKEKKKKGHDILSMFD